MPPPDQDPDAEATAQDEAEQALRTALPTVLKDGYGLRGPNPLIGQDPQEIDGAQGQGGDMQVDGGDGGTAGGDDQPVNDPNDGKDFELLEGCVFFNIDENAFFSTNVWTDGTEDAL